MSEARVSPPHQTKTAGRVSRRRMLGGIGVATALGAVGFIPIAKTGSAEPATKNTTTSTQPNRQWALVIDLRKCDGCVTIGKAPQCVEACNAEHFVPPGQQWLEVLEVQDPGGHTSFFPRPCMQCENAPCTKVCPVDSNVPRQARRRARGPGPLHRLPHVHGGLPLRRTALQLEPAAEPAGGHVRQLQPAIPGAAP